MKRIDKIVTFGCIGAICIYPPECKVYPRSPYKSHDSIEDAEIFLKGKGVKNIHKIIHPSISRDKLGNNFEIHAINNK